MIAQILYMKRRLRIYGFGFALGLIVAWAMFLRGRNTKNYTAWTPNNRILEEIRLDKKLQYSDAFWCEMKCLGFSSIDLDELVNDGNVAFNESDPKSVTKMYRVKLDTDRGTLVIDYLFHPDYRSVKKVFVEGKESNCNC